MEPLPRIAVLRLSKEFAKEFAMTRHLTRSQLLRSFAGAASAMIVCAAAIFTAAHHLAG